MYEEEQDQDYRKTEETFLTSRVHNTGTKDTENVHIPSRRSDEEKPTYPEESENAVFCRTLGGVTGESEG